MSKNRRRHRKNRKKRSETRKLADRVFERESHSRAKEADVDHTNKEQQKKYVKELAEWEQDILSRTIFVSSVKNLNVFSNVNALRAFMDAKYGPVEDCRVHYLTDGRGRCKKKQFKFPPGKVRFRHKRYAEKIFGGMTLAKAKADRVQVEVMSGVAHSGRSGQYLRIQPCGRYEEMVQEFVQKPRLQCSFDTLQVGHWFPNHEDSYTTIFGRDGDYDHSEEKNEFVVGETCTNDLELRVDSNDRNLKIEVRSLPAFDMIPYIHFDEQKIVLEITFKELQGKIMLCGDINQRSYRPPLSLIFRVKYPPKIYRVSYDDRGYEKRTRLLGIPGISSTTFGSCLGFRIVLTEASANSIFASEEAINRLSSFGVLQRRFYPENYEPICIKNLQEEGVDTLTWNLSRTMNRRLALAIRMLVDSAKTCPFYLMQNCLLPDGTQTSFFQLVNQHDPHIVVKAIEKFAALTKPTRHPVKVLHALLNTLQEEKEEDDGIFGDAASIDDDDDDRSIPPEYCAITHRVCLTPTRVLVMGSYQEVSNRIVRHFVDKKGHSPEAFIRVSVADEDGSKIFPDDLSADVCKRIRELIFFDGLRINGHQYKFLAYSSSQLKEASLWMISDEKGLGVEDIRKWMGDFSKCKTASKFAARMGQCFSTTFSTKPLPGTMSPVPTKLLTKADLPDLESDIPDVPHSDGTGLIQQEILQTLITSHPSCPSDPQDVSIVQVRFGGAKGTLSAWDFAKLELGSNRKYDVLLRDSMVKFEADYDDLEVMMIGKLIPYYLNRHVILLLGVHDVPDDIFQDMQGRMLDDLDSLITDPVKTADMIPRLGGPDPMLSCSLLHMLSIGLSPKTDPFLLSCVHAIRSHHLMNLRKKTRIYIDKGAVLLGGVDETGLLPEGCIFVQIRGNGMPSDPERKTRRNDMESFCVLRGPVLVTKHPVMHPGDVRMLLAVDIPELRDQKNVILFSQEGSRPEPHKMSGSDLDGDQFAVTWDSRLFLKQWNGACYDDESGKWTSETGMELDLEQLAFANSAAMDYDDVEGFPLSSKSSDELTSGITVATELSDLSFRMATLNSGKSWTHSGTERIDTLLGDHFINFSKNDNLGRIATMWLDYAAKFGAGCEQCLELAKLSSIAVDFPKSGIPAEIPHELVIRRDTPRAHWRERKDAPSYHCTSVVGKLYDEAVQRLGKEQDIIKGFPSIAGRRIDVNGQLDCSGDFIRRELKSVYIDEIPLRLGGTNRPWREDLVSIARDQQDLYEEKVRGLMNKYKVFSEGEIVTGCIRKFHKLHKRRQYDLCEDVRQQYRGLRRESRQAFFWEVIRLASPSREESALDSEEEEARLSHSAEKHVVGKSSSGRNVATLKFVGEEGLAIRRKAFELAAAYYLVTYNPELRWNKENTSNILFSFPWIVADVIAEGFHFSAHGGF